MKGVAFAALALAIFSRSMAFVFSKYAAMDTKDHHVAFILINP